MERSIDLTSFSEQNSEVLVARKDILAVRFSDKANSRVICGLTPKMSEGANYLTFEVYVHNDEICSCLEFEFFEKGNDSDTSDFFFILGFLPKIYTTVSLPLEALSGKRIFLDRNKGALKFLICGKNVDIRNVERFSIRARKSSFPQRIQISNMRFTSEPQDKMPEAKPLVDKFGQWTGRSWPQKIESEKQLVSEFKKDIKAADCDSFGDERSRFGGWTKLRFEATGYFRAQKDNGRWWMVDPEGYTFFSTGLDCVHANESYTNLAPVRSLLAEIPERNSEFADAFRSDTMFDFAIANLIRAFGNDWYDNWAKLTKSRLFKWGFNTVANWSDMEFARKSHIPYVMNMTDFPKTDKIIFRDFPDVFDEEYQRRSEKFAEQLTATAEDPYLIGYFLSNEPTWAWGERINIAVDMLKNPEDFVSKGALVDFLKERYAGDISALNEKWGRQYADFSDAAAVIAPNEVIPDGMDSDLMDFSSLMIKRYCEIPSIACKKADPNHLNLGLRYASIPNPDILAGCSAFDVFSMNCYKIDPSIEIGRAAAVLDMPIVIGEYHFGALDRGLPASGLRAVSTQEERASAYKYYLHCAASTPNCVGVHYFTLNDQPALGRFDGENYQIGFVNVCGREYDEICEGAIDAHRTMYDVAAGNIPKYNIYPDEVDWIAY